MTEDEQQAIAALIAVKVAAMMAAQSFAVYAVIGALSERGAIDQARVVAWAEVWAKNFERTGASVESVEAAGHLRNFAANLKTLYTVPEGAGRA